MHRSDIETHYLTIKRILAGILFLNFGVALAKIVFGSIGRCSSMTADGFHSLADGTSNIIGIVGIHFAGRPKDADHPYGHKKFETFFSLGIGILLILVCVSILHETFTSLRLGTHPAINRYHFAVMLVTILINIGVMRYESRRGEALKSDILTADAMHTRADILTSLSVIVAFLGIRLGLPLIDPIIAILITFVIAHSAIEIFREGAKVLCDQAVFIDKKEIAETVRGINGVVACHKIRSRGRPDDVHLDLHVQVSGAMRVSQAHEISYAIEDTLRRRFPSVADVIVHIEPDNTPPRSPEL